MRNELECLELQVQQQLATLNCTASVPGEKEHFIASPLRVTLFGLKTPSSTRKKQQRQRLQSLVQEALLDVINTPNEGQDSPSASVYEASKTSRLVARLRSERWRVYFRNGEPSFYFHPFTREQFDRAIKGVMTS